jgi:hypothetical protein
MGPWVRATIRNCDVSACNTGIKTQGGLIADCGVTSCGFAGIDMRLGWGLIRGCQSEDCSTGIWSNGRVEDCVVTGNITYGVLLATQASVRGTLARGNGRGFYSASGRNRIQDCVAMANTLEGVFAVGAVDVSGSRICLNGGDGIGRSAGSGNHYRIKDCVITGNLLAGISLPGFRVEVRDCQVTGNGGLGVRSRRTAAAESRWAPVRGWNRAW